MKAIVISGSERRFGITSHVSEKTEFYLSKLGVSTKVIYLNEVNFTPCNSCGSGHVSCNYREAPCEKDDDIKMIINQMVASNIIIYACPVHAFGIAHLMQNFLERAGVGYLRFNRPLANKVGGCIIVGRKYHLGHAHDQIVNNMLLNRMIIPGSGFPVLLHGDEKNKSISDTEEMVALEQMIARLVEVCSSIDSSSFNQNWDNERVLKEKKDKNNDQ